MKKLLVLPTWLIVILTKSFLPSGHLFKKKITLTDWCNNSTDLNRAFSFLFWIFLIVIPIAFYNLIS